MMGDFNQRINDNEKIESFLTSNSLTTFFSLMSILIYLLILGYFNLFILFVFGLFTLCAVLWSVYWLKKIKIIEYFKFQEKSKNQDAIFDMLKGINEIKLNNFERFKINNWKKIQLNLFKIKIRSLKINQIQSIGFEFFNQIKNILVTYLSAKYVIEGQMSLGVLLSISFIIGQLNSPIDQLIFFFKSLQDAKLSMNRIQEIEEHDNEDYNSPIILDSKLREDIHINNLDFQFSGPKSPRILNGINLTLPKGKITAIVGHSGSGKTTLMKLLLKFYKINNGEIKYGDYNINDINSEELRKNIGVVMQDGHVFSDTIERNIATSDEFIDYEKINNAIQVANLQDYISSLPLGLKTMIGESGNGISGGQKQRILIARAVYKNPNYIFFDEATSALDSENEKIIHENLNNFFHNKTVIIIAHRLSTVKNSDQIVVLKNGEIKEIGTHNQLIDKKGDYFNLIKNQLELSV